MRVIDFNPVKPWNLHEKVDRTFIEFAQPDMDSGLGDARACQTLGLFQNKKTMSYIDFPMDTVYVCMEKKA